MALPGPGDPEDDSDPINWSEIIGTPEIPSSLSDIAPDFAKYTDTLIAIAKNPKSFVLSALLAALLGFVLDIAKVFYDAIRLVLIGGEVGYVEGGTTTIGIEDLFYILWNIISDAGEAVGSPIIGLITDLQNSALGLAEGAGIASFPLSVLMIVVTIVGFYIILSNLGRATLAAIPVIGPFLEVILFE